MSPIAGVVLAAGMSRRLGRPKQLLMLGGRPLIAHVADRAVASGVDEVVVVTGAHADAIHHALAHRAVQFVHNPRFEQGQGTSLSAGIAALDAGVDAAVILLADQPGISSATIDRMIEVRRRTGAPVVVARYGQERGHPVLFGREVFPELMALTGDTGGRLIVRAHRDEVVFVDGGAESPPSDVDTEQAWEDLQREWSPGEPDSNSSD